MVGKEIEKAPELTLAMMVTMLKQLSVMWGIKHSREKEAEMKKE